jgi:hypothetical protein
MTSDNSSWSLFAKVEIGCLVDALVLAHQIFEFIYMYSFVSEKKKASKW